MSRPSKSQSRDYFGTFLETVNAPVERRKTPEQAGAEATLTPMRILAELRSGDQVLLADIQERVGLGFVEFAEALATFRQAGLIKVHGKPGSEKLELTEAGRIIAGSPPE